ncbi:hypothetical protein CBR_g19073 [Chara braunii]|uniref:Uncharacterized protein n=1 Tax=Chara braunii TaxID=69332 RepID=A0A388KX90_CHABU|nr:hypothetical protein CBR_g19073 [Chara braunii]|eukprot:GBG74665.1 hypothetical protein CBR_g19073 [Chara braunii]
MENTTPQPPQAQPPMPPFQSAVAPPIPLFQSFYPNPFPAPQSFPNATPQYAFPMSHGLNTATANWAIGGPTSVPAQAGGQFSRGDGRGNGSYQPHAFFTREHANFIEKLKLKDAVEEARKKDLEEIARLRGLGWEVEEQKGRVPDTEKEKSQGKGKNKKQGGKHRGREKVDEAGKEDEMKKWVATNFGGSLRILSEKLEEVEKKSSLEVAELEELKLLRAEKELRELRENSSSEKRKRDIASPAKRKRKVRSRSKLLRKAGRGGNAKYVEVSSDDDSKGQDAVVQNLSRIACSKGRDASSSNTGGTQGAMKVAIGMEQADQKGEAGPSGEKSEKGKGKEEGGLGMYFKDRVVYYDAMHHTEIPELCKKKGVPYKCKEAGVWELARLDFEVLLKIENAVDEKEEIDDEKGDEGSKDSSESSSSSDEEAQDDDIAGN